MAARTRHRVTAVMIVAKIPGAQGGEAYLRQGRLLPDSVTSEEIKRLKGLGLIEAVKVEDAGDDAAKKAAEEAAAKKAAEDAAKQTPPAS